MPIIGLGVHVLIAIFFAVHAMRTGQPLYWLFILFSFPMLGSVVYFLTVFLPNSRLERGTRKAMVAAARSLDPTREIREARAAFEFTPTAQNQMRLAAALLEAGAAEEAAANYDACLKGPLASDPEIRFCAARAFLESGQAERALQHLQALRQDAPTFREEQVSLLLARSLAAARRSQEARSEFESALHRFGSFEAHGEYAIWALTSGDRATAERLQGELDKMMQRWKRHTRELHRPLLRRLAAAQEIFRRAA